MSSQKQGSGDRAGEERDDLSEGAALSSDEAHATDEARATPLAPPPEELSALARAFYDLTLDYIGSPNALPVFPATDAARLAEIFRRPLPEEGCGLESRERDCREVVRHSRQNGAPRMFGYVASPSAPAGTLASLLAAALNSNVTSWRSAPAATEVERTVVGWLAELIGFKGEGLNQPGGGLLTSGGSMANLDALFVAHRAKSREAALGIERDRPGDSSPDASRGVAHDPSREGLWNAAAPMTIYASDQVHLSIPKAADILGIGREQVRLVPSDERFRFDVRALGERVEADGRAGLRP